MSGTFLASRGVGVFSADASNVTFAIANNLRIASLSIAAYDYILTLPAEIRLYRGSSRRSLGFILFILIRYTSVIVLFTSNFGFFYHHFTPKACSYYCYVPPVFKVIQLMVSQAILGIRTYNVAQRHIRIGRIIASAYFFASVSLWLTALYDRQAEMKDGNCMIGSAHPDQPISALFFYLITVLYDFLVLSISTYYLLTLRSKSACSPSRKLLNILFNDGLGFFVALTAINLANVLIHRGVRVGSAIRTSATSLEYAVVWIMSQRILIHLRQEVAQQAALMMSQGPRANPSFSGPHLHRPTYRNMPDENATLDFGNNYDTGELNDFNVGVRVQRAIIRGIRPLDEESETTAERVTAQVRDERQEKLSALMRASDQIARNSLKRGYI